MAAENSTAGKERGSGEDKRVTETLLTQLITDTSKKALPLMDMSHLSGLIFACSCTGICLLNNLGKKVLFAANKTV